MTVVRRFSILAACLLVLLAFLPIWVLRAQDSSYTAQQINDAFVLGKVRAHLLAARDVWQAEQYTFAATHAGHAKAEAYSIQDDLKAKNADTALNGALDTFFALAGQSGDSTKFKDASDQAQKAVDDALQATVGNSLTEPKFRAAVIVKLVHAVEADYEAAYNDGKIIEPVEYQDARGFALVAEEHWTAILDSVGKDVPKDLLPVADKLAALKAALPDFVKLPEQPAKPADVEKAVDGVSEALRAAFNLPAETEQIGTEAIQMTRDAVVKALSEYQSGDADAAYEAAASAYLDHFEALESDLRKKDSQLVDTLEGQFKDLRDGIKAGKPIAELSALASQININLDKAAALLAAK
jgi:hypothetical protein